MIKYIIILLIMISNYSYANSIFRMDKEIYFKECKEKYPPNMRFKTYIPEELNKDVTIVSNAEIEKVIDIILMDSGYKVVYWNKKPYNLLLNINEKENIFYFLDAIQLCNNSYFENISIIEEDKKIVIKYYD